jgi:hypothetical protein
MNARRFIFLRLRQADISTTFADSLGVISKLAVIHLRSAQIHAPNPIPEIGVVPRCGLVMVVARREKGLS